MAGPASPFEPHAEGVRVRIRLTPKAGANRFGGVFVDAAGRARIKARVTAAPEKGKANTALLKLLSKSWGVGMQRLHLITGHKDRNKTVLVAGGTGEVLAMLETWLHSRQEG